MTHPAFERTFPPMSPSWRRAPSGVIRWVLLASAAGLALTVSISDCFARDQKWGSSNAAAAAQAMRAKQAEMERQQREQERQQKEIQKAAQAALEAQKAAEQARAAAMREMERQQREAQREQERMREAQRQAQQAIERAMKAAEQEQRKLAEQQQRQAEEQRRQAEQLQRKQAEEQRRQAEQDQRRQSEDQRRQAEQEQRRQGEEQRRQAEQDQRRQGEGRQRQAVPDRTRQGDANPVRKETQTSERPNERNVDFGDDAAPDRGTRDSEERAKTLEREHARLLELERRRLAEQATEERERQRALDDARALREQRREARRLDAARREGAPEAPSVPIALPAPPSVETAPVSPAAPYAAPVPDAASPDLARTEGLARQRTVRPVANAPVVYPGKDLGAELPPDLYAKARAEEFIVPALSPADIERAKSRGFDVSTPVSVGASGAKVQRLRVPGYAGNEAERELHKMFFAPVSQNHAYGIYVGSLGEAGPGAPEMRNATAVTQQPCPDDVCFGGKFINWSPTAGSCAKAAKIGIIDTSFDIGHPAFNTLQATSRSFLEDEKPSPYDWHGTAVLSLLAGNAGTSTPGLAPDAQYVLATAFRSDAAGNASSDTVRLLAALAWLEESNVDVVNMSFSGPHDPAVASAIAQMSKKGIVFVAAAGNMGPNAPPSYPAAYPQVIAVTAVNRKGNNYRNANRGSYVDVSAPGVDILTALPRSQQGYKTGTSFAAPFVTAILATHGDLNFTGAKSDVLTRLSLRDLGPPGRDPTYGVGLALAPSACVGGGVASAVELESPAPVARAGGSWVTNTTIMRAGAGP